MAQKFFRALVQIVIHKEVKGASKQECAGSNSSSDLLVALLQLYIVPQDKSIMIMKAAPLVLFAVSLLAANVSVVEPFTSPPTIIPAPSSHHVDTSSSSVRRTLAAVSYSCGWTARSIDRLIDRC